MATFTDATVVYEYIHKLAEYEGLSECVVSTAADMVRMLQPDYGLRAVLAFMGNQPVGFATFYLTLSTFAGRSGLYIEDLYVDEGFRKAGVGRALMAWLATWALDHDCDRMSWMALDWNHAAHHFYERLGAHANESWRPFVIQGQALENLGNTSG